MYGKLNIKCGIWKYFYILSNINILEIRGLQNPEVWILAREKYRNFTWFPGVETVPFRKISTPGNQVKLRYFSQCWEK